MSARGQLDILEIVGRYAAGYFPLYDLEERFYWERLAFRAVLEPDAAMVRRAQRMSRRGGRRFEVRYSTAVEQVIAAVAREDIKPRTWVRREVVHIYRVLHAAGLLRTVEAWNPARRELAGALVGIVLPGMFVAETMYHVAPETSKICLCRLVEDCFAAGLRFIDVQTPHDLDEFGRRIRPAGRTPHPCIRLGEKVLMLAAFMRQFELAWRRQFSGGPAEWAMAGWAVRQGPAGAVPAGVTARMMQEARRLLSGLASSRL